MKKTLGKLVALVAVLAIIACFTFALVACNEKPSDNSYTTKDLTAEEAETLLFHSTTGAFRTTGNATNVKITFSEESGDSKRAGEASEYYVTTDKVKQGTSTKNMDITTTYSNISIFDGTATSNRTYYLAYKPSTNYYYGPYYLLRENGNVINEGYSNNINSDAILVNACRSDSGLNDANAKIQGIKDAVKNDDDGTITYSAVEYYLGETYAHTMVYANYSYTDASGKVEGVATIKVIKSDYCKAGSAENGNVIETVGFEESGYSYFATYNYNAGEIEIPMTAEGWIAECPIA